MALIPRRLALGLLAAALIGLLSAILIAVDTGDRNASADSPHAGLNFAIGIDADGGGDDCDTNPDTVIDMTCPTVAGSSFTTTLYVTTLGGLAYEGFDSVWSFSGPTTAQTQTFVWPSCVFEAVFYPPVGAGAALGCARGTSGADSTYTGALATIDLNCTASGSVDLVHGLGNTQLTAQAGTHSEASGTEGLSVTCGGAVTPTSTVTATATNTNTPTATATNTSVPATNTPAATATNTSVPATNTPTATATNTSVPPTNTPTATATNTSVPATNTPTATATNTPLPATNTPTATATNTSVPATNTPTPTPGGEEFCADVTGNGKVTFHDLLLILVHFRSHNERFDVNEDGMINLQDLLMALDQLGDRCERDFGQGNNGNHNGEENGRGKGNNNGKGPWWWPF